ncbi:MAG TPA: lysoplasmalogenase, partial [Pyrinomonadaceae bacterium]|nr:lysoplasmalogenase [Pyrinomonadaceae bacterium]
MLTIFLSSLVIVSALLHLRAEVCGPRRNIYFFKPLTMVFIILIALQTKHAVSPFYKYAILCGLLFSLAGDIFLMLPTDKFIAGLVSFLLAHLCYIAAFTFEGAYALNFLYAIPLLVYGAVMLRVLWPGLASMKAPVMIYMLVIIAMAWQALNRWAATGEQGSALAFA